MIDKKIVYFTFCLLSIGLIVQSQTNGLSSSPYSLYGLGLSNQVSTGKTNSLGKTGIAMPSDNSINNLNPASFAGIGLNSFFFDLGIKAERVTLYEDGNNEPRFNANFSNIAFAFPITKYSGFGLTLTPYTNVGYAVLGIESEIDGDTDTFLTNITGAGGLDDVKLNYAISIAKKLRIGLSSSFLFGNITENEIDLINGSILNITEKNHYEGFRFGTGFQFDITEKITLGSIINFPTNLKARQTKTINLNGFLQKETSDNLDSFKLPLEIGFGVHTKINEKLFFNLDLKKNFWTQTEQSDQIGDYVDQYIIGFGAEYIPRKNGFSYWERINYRAGFNFDNGNLAISDERVSNYTFDLGIGIPYNSRSNSMLNLGYSYGQRGQISNGLIKENYHLLTLNLSFEGIWFKKKKIN